MHNPPRVTAPVAIPKMPRRGPSFADTNRAIIAGACRDLAGKRVSAPPLDDADVWAEQ